MSWEHAKRCLNLSLVRYSYFWLFFVPVCAHVLLSIDRPIQISFGGRLIEIPLELPFSWKLFYFGAVCFSLAGFLFTLLCPPLVRDFDTYHEYSREGRGLGYILDQLFWALLLSNRSEPPFYKSSGTTNIRLKRFLDRHTPSDFWSSDPKYAKYREVDEADEQAMKCFFVGDFPIREWQIKEESLGAAFWFTRDIGNSMLPGIRVAIIVLSYAGVSSYIWVAFQGLRYVWRAA